MSEHRQNRYRGKLISVQVLIDPKKNPELADALEQITQQHNGNKSEAIRAAIALYAQHVKPSH